MEHTERVRTAVERTVRALTRKPSLARGTGRSTVTVRDGLTCEVVEGPWRFTVDMPESIGGSATGPTPGVYGRGALGSCLAIGYMMWAAQMGVPIDSLQVQVEADYDDNGLLGTTDVAPGYAEVRYTVTVESSASEAQVMRVIDAGDAHSPYLDIFRRAQVCARRVDVKSPAPK